MNAIATQFPELPTPAAVLERTWRATWFVGESKLDHCIEQHAVYTADQMHQYARDYAAMLAAPAASGAHPDALPDGTLSKSTAKRLAAAAVSERARELLAAEFEKDGLHDMAAAIRAGHPNWELSLRALEQALTQQHALSSPRQEGDYVSVPRAMLIEWRKAFSEEAAAYAPDKLHHVDLSIEQISALLTSPTTGADGGGE